MVSFFLKKKKTYNGGKRQRDEKLGASDTSSSSGFPAGSVVHESLAGPLTILQAVHAAHLFLPTGDKHGNKNKTPKPTLLQAFLFRRKGTQGREIIQRSLGLPERVKKEI